MNYLVEKLRQIVPEFPSGDGNGWYGDLYGYDAEVIWYAAKRLEELEKEDE